VRVLGSGLQHDEFRNSDRVRGVPPLWAGVGTQGTQPKNAKFDIFLRKPLQPHTTHTQGMVLVAFDEVLLAKTACLDWHGCTLVNLKPAPGSAISHGADASTDTETELQRIHAYLTIDTQSTQRQVTCPELKWTEINQGVLGIR